MTTLTASIVEADNALTADSASPERIAELTEDLVPKLQMATKAISTINNQTRLLSFNAQIEASRAGGGTGAAFGVVASAMRDLADKTVYILNTLEKETAQANSTLQHIIQILATSVRGTRLSDLAHTNIDLIDRNLYERSCDVRWWATDSAPVEALTAKNSEAYSYCSKRFGLILNSYTVYYDLVLCDMSGMVVANGRPDQYRSVGTDCSKSEWFQSALSTKSGEEFGFEGVHKSALVTNNRVLVYSCCVREGGDINAAPIGVLGIVFNWDALAQTIVQATPLTSDEQLSTRVCIVDSNGMVLADSSTISMDDNLNLNCWDLVTHRGKGFTESTRNGKKVCIGFAYSPGYETYRTNWYSLILQNH